MSEDHRRIEVNWVQAMAGALAAVTSAVLLSTVGVAGTLIGAALGSLAVTFGNAVYSYTIGATKERVATASTQAAAKIGRAQTLVQSASQGVRAGEPGAEEELEAAGEDLHRAQAVLVEERERPPKVGWKAVLAGLPWKRIALASAGVFVAAMLVILTFELVTGRAVSSYTGGSDSSRHSSVPGLGGSGGGGDEEDPQPVPQQTATDGGPTQEPTESAQPTQDPTVTEETAVPPLTEAPSEGETSEPTTPAPTPTPTPTPNTATTPTPAPSP